MVNAIARATGNNLRLVQRPLVEIERVLTVNGLPSITTEVLAFARESLVIGTTTNRSNSPTRNAQSYSSGAPVHRTTIRILTDGASVYVCSVREPQLANGIAQIHASRVAQLADANGGLS